jgi:hypothetical protein
VTPSYRDGRYKLAGEAFHRMQHGERVGGQNLDAYIDLLAHRQIVERTFDSDRLQDALQAARDWQRAVEMIDELHQQTGGENLDYGQRQSMQTLLAARDDVIARYPDPQGILNMKAKHDQSIRTLQRETVRARAAAIAEHIDAQPGWVTVVGTQPTGRRLRETWREAVQDLAGRYVDAQAQQELQRTVAVTVDRAADTARTTRETSSDLLAQAHADAQARFNALLADPDNPTLLQASLDAQRAAEQIELDSEPRWLTGTLGQRPVDLQLAEQWDRLGRKMIGLRDNNAITDEIDNAYNRADFSLRRAIGRFRLDAGLDQPQPSTDIDRGHGLAD